MHDSHGSLVAEDDAGCAHIMESAAIYMETNSQTCISF